MESRSTVAEILYVLRRYWLLAIAVFSIILLCGFTWLSSQRPMYEISSIVSDKQDSLSANSGSGGLGALAGGLLNIKQDASGAKSLQEMVYTPELAREIETRYHVSHTIFPERWDQSARRWRPPNGSIYRLTSTISGVFGIRNSSDVTIEDLQIWLLGINFTESEIDRNTYKISFFYPDPDVGRRLMGVILGEADRIARQQQMAQADARRRYLEARLAVAQTPEQHTALVQLIERVEMRNVIGHADQFFLIDIVSPPQASDRIKRPRYTVVSALIVIAATFITLSFVWSVAVLRRRPGVIVQAATFEMLASKDRTKMTGSPVAYAPDPYPTPVGEVGPER